MNAINVSVVIPTFHREAMLLEAIDSVLSQKGVSFEVIVVDDSPEGSARAAVSAITDPRVSYVLRDRPSGGRPAQVRNEGAQRAQGTYLHFLDDDDQLKPGALLKLSTALSRQPSAGMAFGGVEPFGADPTMLEHHRRYYEEARRIALRLHGRDQLSACLVFKSAVLINSACMARRDAFLAVGGFDVDIPICEDADLWSRIVQSTGFIYVDEPVVRYRTGAPSMMHNLAANDARLHASYRRMQNKHREINGLWRSLSMKFWARAILR